MLNCPECGAPIDADADDIRCPRCGALLDAPGWPEPRALVIDVSARGEDGAPVGEPVEPERAEARPVFEERVYSGRAWPGGPFVQGRTVVFSSGGPIVGDGRGCCGCGCLVAGLLALLCLRGLLSLF